MEINEIIALCVAFGIAALTAIYEAIMHKLMRNRLHEARERASSWKVLYRTVSEERDLLMRRLQSRDCQKVICYQTELERAEEDLSEIVHETNVEVRIPLSDRSFCEIDILFRILRIDLIELFHRTAVAVPCRTVSPFICLRISIDIERIVILASYVVVTVVMVEEENLDIAKTSLFHSRSEDLDKLLLILPRHVHRH